ncbi:MAG: nickel pincer cofactor biosynthesis protein LarB [Candidatus Hydrothermarchaeota archaeon]
MSLRDVLEDFQHGKLSLEEAEKEIRLFQLARISNWGKIDTHRHYRTGIPEAVFCEGKSDEEVLPLASQFIQRTGRCIMTRIAPGRMTGLKAGLKKRLPKGTGLQENGKAGVLIVKRKGYATKATGGKIAILSAGASDVGRAEEARIIAEEMGCRVYTFYDVGVAGIHRLIPAIGQIVKEGIDIIVVAAGMEGALPSVVAGLVDIPVVGLPISTGYGLGGKGEAALLSILQSCSPGLVAVNIDNGFGAGAFAAMVANRTARRKGL